MLASAHSTVKYNYTTSDYESLADFTSAAERSNFPLYKGFVMYEGTKVLITVQLTSPHMQSMAALQPTMSVDYVEDNKGWLAVSNETVKELIKCTPVVELEKVFKVSQKEFLTAYEN